ncbi:MAG TPA: hypothetical protein VFQ44_05240 [Streptosporangiaceae bacterium]|nr:hypothetical protein [Streptosporangiaceae bacterium]
MDTFWSVDFPTWLVGVGTVGAFGTGGMVLLKEIGRDREREAAIVRQQATTIAAWPARRESPADIPPTISAHLVLNNASAEPVYDVHVSYEPKTAGPVLTDEIDLLPPGRDERELPRSLQETWIKSPNGWVRQGPPQAQPISKPHAEPWAFLVSLSFVDARGQRWRRGTDGSIVKI